MYKPSKLNKQIHRHVNKIVGDYKMLVDGDRIAVGLSGGKDSMTMLLILSERLRSVRYDYKLFPIYIDPGFDGGFGHDLEKFCEEQGYNFTWEKSDFGILAHSKENRANPCFLCSRLRRKRLFEIADTLHCTTLALGHTKDDLIETLFINMFYSGRIGTMVPKQSLFNDSFRIIRPLGYVEEKDIVKYSVERKIPIFNNPCPSSENSKRKEIKELLENIYKVNPNIKGNIFRSMSHVNQEYLLT